MTRRHGPWVWAHDGILRLRVGADASGLDLGQYPSDDLAGLVRRQRALDQCRRTVPRSEPRPTPEDPLGTHDTLGVHDLHLSCDAPALRSTPEVAAEHV